MNGSFLIALNFRHRQKLSDDSDNEIQLIAMLILSRTWLSGLGVRDYALVPSTVLASLQTLRELLGRSLQSICPCSVPAFPRPSGRLDQPADQCAIPRQFMFWAQIVRDDIPPGNHITIPEFHRSKVTQRIRNNNAASVFNLILPCRASTIHSHEPSLRWPQHGAQTYPQ